jgi:hypothetical protein
VDRTHLEWVELAAKIMQQDGVSDPLQAITRAAKMLRAAVPAGTTTGRPKPEHVLAALGTRLALFRPADARPMLRAALEAMPFFEAFAPRLIGPLALGLAPDHAQITLELVAEQVDDVHARLAELKIPATQQQSHRSGRLQQSSSSAGRGRTPAVSFHFQAGEFSYQLHICGSLEARAPAGKSLDYGRLKAMLAGMHDANL